MESTGEPGRIHVSDAFAALLAEEQRGHASTAPRGLAVTPRGLVDVKSKGKMETFWLQRPAPSPSLLALARALSPPPSPSLVAMAFALSPRPMSPGLSLLGPSGKDAMCYDRFRSRTP